MNRDLLDDLEAIEVDLRLLPLHAQLSAEQPIEPPETGGKKPLRMEELEELADKLRGL